MIFKSQYKMQVYNLHYVASNIKFKIIIKNNNILYPLPGIPQERRTIHTNHRHRLFYYLVLNFEQRKVHHEYYVSLLQESVKLCKKKKNNHTFKKNRTILK